MRGEISIGIFSFIVIGALVFAIQRTIEARKYRHSKKLEPPKSTVI